MPSPYIGSTIGALVLLGAGWVVWAGEASSSGIAGVLLAIGIAVSVVAPGAGIAGVLAAAPTMYELHPMPRGHFSLLELAILVFVAGVGMRVLWSLLHRDVDDLVALFQPAQVVVPIVLILVATAIAIMTLAEPEYRNASLREVRTVIIEPLLFLAAARIAMRRPEIRSIAGTAFVATGVGVALIALVQVMFTDGGVVAGNITRATGPYPHPNNLSFFLERSLIFTTALVVLRPRWWLAWAAIAIQLAGLGGTFSRGALLAAACGVVVPLLLRGKYRWILGLGVAGVAVLAGALAIAPDRLVDVGGSGSEPTRFTIWRASFRMAQDHPILGVGPDQFYYQYWRRYVEPMGWPERYTSHPHNIVLDIWLRLGVAGLAAFGSLAIGVVWWIRARIQTVRNDIWAVGGIGALAGGLVHGLVDNGFFLPDLATWTWFFIAMLITIPAADRAREGE